MKYETYNFSDSFQDAIIACVIRKPEEFNAVGRVVRPIFFNGATAYEVVERIQQYVEKYGKYPNFSTLGNFATHKAKKTSIDHAKKIMEYVEKLRTVDTSDWKAIRDLCVDFARERAVHVAIKRIYEAQQDNKMEEVNAVELMREAVSIGINSGDIGMSFYEDSDKAIDKITALNYGVKTGYAPFDKLWPYGWGPGWLIVPLAPPKRYKTGFCINLALNMIRDSENIDVLYYACEISEELAMMRGYYSLTGLTEEAVMNSTAKAKASIKAKLHEQVFGHLWFKGFPSKGVTLAQIRDHARFVISEKGLNPKAIIIDYADTVKPTGIEKNTPDHRQQADVYTQARAIGSELGCCVIMPDRCNKETVGRKVPNMKSFQGAFEKAGIVDVAIGLCQTDGEHKQKRMRYFVFLNRHGEDMKHYEGKVDPERMRLTVDKEIEYVPDDEEDSLPEEGWRQRKSKRNAPAEAHLTQND